MVDNAKPSVYLEPDLSVASIFVDEGKARADGYDQYGIVCVIQTPSQRRAQRFGSVVHDWDSTATEAKRRLSQKIEAAGKQISPIEEENDSMADISVKRRHRDFPLSSVEDAAIPGTPPFDHQGSEELGGDPPGAQESHPEFLSRKRRQSSELDMPVKEPRLGNTTRTQPAPEIGRSTLPPSPARHRQLPAYASPKQRRPSVQKPSSPLKRGLGIGIAKSPSAMLLPQSSQVSSNSLPLPSSAPSPSLNRGSVMEISQSLQPSALRKNASLDKYKRQPVSFAEANTSAGRNDAMSTPQNPAKNPSMSSATPSSSQIVYPSSFSAERIQRMKDDAEKKFGHPKEQGGQKEDTEAKIHTEKRRKTKDEAQNQEDLKPEWSQNLTSGSQKDAEEARKIRDKLQDLEADSPAREILVKLLNNYGILEKAKATNNSMEKKNCLRRVRRLENKLKHLESASPPPTEHPLPQSASKVTRSIPSTTPATSQHIDTTPSSKNRSYTASTPVPSVVIPIASPGKQTSGANTGPETDKLPAKRPEQEVNLVSTSSSDYAEAHQNADDEQDSNREEQGEHDNALDGFDGAEQEARRQVQAEMLLGGSGEYSAEESEDQEAQQQVQTEMQLDGPGEFSAEGSEERSEEGPEERSDEEAEDDAPRNPADMFIDDEAESDSGSESKAESVARSGSESEYQTESESDDSGKEPTSK